MFKQGIVLLSVCLAIFLAFTGCRHRKDDISTPPPPPPPLPVNDNYLVKTISLNGIVKDSLVYANGRISEQWQFSSSYYYCYKFSYDINDRLILSICSSNSGISIKDSLKWSADKVLSYVTFSAGGVIQHYDTTLFKMDESRRLTGYFFKDTTNVPSPKVNDFWEGAFKGNNLVSSFWRRKNGNFSNDEIFTLEYGRLGNPLAKYLRNNPLSALAMLGNYGPFMLSDYNMTKMKSPNGESTISADATNFPGTENILTQTIREGNNTKTITYSYVPKP
ncbi:hypothetical protein [Chitinophaga arvensicola]|uniref:Uncharacterized protein n=1 Tax=Chitinophaga arvensicola TaxID=29529 RepID=A0A1I0SCM8_9BACT|nr:hypothetical protein [Chitinophaga arvensicola]SEW54692.1 hypothetical protein SAMN04488122_6128 [Chitinophaga arvensicola]